MFRRVVVGSLGGARSDGGDRPRSSPSPSVCRGVGGWVGG